MKTAAYTIIQNNISRLETWLHYTQQFDYRILLDTGSTDGTFEELQKINDTNLIIKQQQLSKELAKDYILNMIPKNVDFCFELDSHEWFQLGTADKVKELVDKHSDISKIGCTRLDLNSYIVWNGPPNKEPSYKIHRLNPLNDKFIFSDQFFLINDENSSIYNIKE